MSCTLVSKNEFVLRPNFCFTICRILKRDAIQIKHYYYYYYLFVTVGTTPSGDVNIEYNSGTPLEITCNLNPNHELLQKILSDETADNSKSKLLSQKIMFYKNDERVAKQYVSIINSTAAQLRVSNLSASSDVYTCMVCLDKNNHGIKLSKAADISSINMALRNSIMNTVGYRPNESVDTDIGVCLNNVNVGCKYNYPIL